MFAEARVKLTAWYLLIIMAISLSFSAFIYRSVTIEFQRRLDAIEGRLQLRQLGFGPPPGHEELFIEDILEARKRLILILLYTNGAIFVLSGIAGYFLAGKTLAPIEDTLEEQKRFVADASHELRTPLTALQTSIEVSLRDKKLGLTEAKKVLRESLDDIGNLTSLSNNLLTLTRYQQNGMNLTYERLNIKTLIENVYKKLAPLAVKKKIKVTILAKNINIKTDRESVEKLLTILLDNALKYTPKNGEVKISAEKSNKALVIKVSDNGAGIPKQDLPHIFERFYRVDASRSKVNVSGFGLGLSMAKRIVEMHKGSIHVESSFNKGSTFRVKLPLHKA